MNLDDLTLGQVKELAKLLAPLPGVSPAPAPDHPYPVGENVFIRTVTHHYTGKLVKVYPNELVLTDAAWIAEDGRFNEALATGSFNEVEPYPEGEVIVTRGCIVDCTRWPRALPRAVK